LLLDGLKRSAEAQYGGRARYDSAVRVVITATVDTGTTLLGVPVNHPSAVTSTDIYLPGNVDAVSCVVVLRAMARRALNERRTGFVGDPCYWYWKYGLPGRGVQAILDSTRNQILVSRPFGSFSFPPEQFIESAMRSDARAVRCAAGDLDLCEALITGRLPRPADLTGNLESPKWVGIGRYYGHTASYLPAMLLARAEQELAGDVFARLWKSDAAFSTAFRDARGEELGAWIREAMTANVGTHHSGPTPTPRLWVVLALGVPALLAIGAYGVARRAGAL
jgi:hypothetical protein